MNEDEAYEMPDDMLDNDIYLEIPEVTFPHDFKTLNSGDLYDLFVTDKANGMGACGRSVFCALAKEKPIFKSIPAVDEWDSELGSFVAKKKADRERQKALFVRLCTEYGDQFYARVIHHCENFFIQRSKKAILKRKREEATEGKVALDVSDSFAARVAHLVVESGSKEILEQIYAVQGGRASIDDKKQRVGQLWEDIAANNFNNPQWELEKFDSLRNGPCGVEFINPKSVLTPNVQHSAAEIRQTFNSLKSMYSVVYTKFHSSGNNEGGGDEFEDSIDSDDEFYEKFAKTWYPKNARVLLYAHLLWSRAPPAFCLRTKNVNKQSQIGVPGTDIIPPPVNSQSRKEVSLADFGDKIANALKALHTKNPTEIQEEQQKLQKQSEVAEAQIGRDDAMKRYYTALAMEHEMRLSQKKPKFNPDSFKDVNEFLKLARFSDDAIETYTQTLAHNGFTTVFSLGTLTHELLAHMHFPLGAATSIMAIVTNMSLF